MIYDYEDMVLIFACIAGMVCGAIPMIVGALKNQPLIGLGGFVACTIAGIIFGLLLAIPVAGLFTWWIVRTANKKAREDVIQQFKKCPYCAENILADATVCRYCGHNLPLSQGTF